MLADRINVWEGIIGDLSRGHIPNFIKEHGLKSEWKYNKKGFIAKAAVRVAAVAIIALVIFNKREKKAGPDIFKRRQLVCYQACVYIKTL